ncbi:MAG TPA: asparagine synthase-related protein, partial [Nitrospiraceae bacterium]|nr:asparagine synthase-related protein [Nitrospiraceae bacterium]
MQVSNFIWIGDEPVSERSFSTAADLLRFLPEMSGQFAIHMKEHNGGELLVRDPLGVNKLFFAVGADTVESSNFLIDLIRRGHRLSEVFSVPSGHSISVHTFEQKLELKKYRKLEFAQSGATTHSLDDYAFVIRERMAEVFHRLRKVLYGRRLFVTLSGGLDSTTIAVAARQYLGEFTAVTFAMNDDRGQPEPSEDLHFATLVAAELGVPIETVFATPDEISALLDVALTYGQDWREFNVHCALVNARIAEHLAKTSLSGRSGRPVVLTGDVMNELMADYAPVTFREREFYSLPRLPSDRLRRFLVSGLDSGDREVGVFSYFGMDVIQPYAMLADVYASLPAAHIQNVDSKKRLVRKI